MIYRDPDAHPTPATTTGAAPATVDAYAMCTENDGTATVPPAPKPEKKRTYKKGTVDSPEHKSLTDLKTTMAQLKLCLALREHAETPCTTFNGSSKTFVVRRLKPILQCFDTCCGGDQSKFLADYPGKLTMNVFGANKKCKHNK